MNQDRSSFKASMRHFSILGVFGVVLVLGTIGAWAAFTEIQGAVIAPGRLVVETNAKRIQHREGGIVDRIHVKNGDEVLAGQLLVTLDETEIRAELSIVEDTRAEWIAKIARLQAQLEKADAIMFPQELLLRRDTAEIEALLEGQNRLFHAQNASLESRKKQLLERIGQLEREITGLEAQLRSEKKQHQFITSELEDSRMLLDQGLTQRSRVFALEREGVRIEGQQGQLVAAIARAEGRISEIRLQLIQLDDDARTNALSELREAEAAYKEYSERQIALRARIDRISIRSPRNGIVHELNVHTVGGVIGSGETIMLIIPREDKLVIETAVRPEDIDQVYPGQDAFLRFRNADNRLTPQIRGEVFQVSADLEHGDENTPPHYSVRLSTTEDQLRKIGDLKMRAGMPVEAFIQTEARSPLSYLVQPLSEQVARAFREQ